MPSVYKLLFGVCLTIVSITLCQTLTMLPARTSCVRHDKHVECSNLNLKSVPDDIPEDTTSLILRHNSITILPPDSFNKFPHLVMLDLSHNRLINLHKDVFKGLHKLKRIDLSHNSKLGLEGALDSLGPLEHQQLEEILLVRVNHQSTIQFDRTLFEKLKNICVETLDVSDNVIGGIDLSPIVEFKYRECYKTFRFARHLITHLPPSVIFLRLLTNLTELDMSGSPGPGQLRRQRRVSTRLNMHRQTSYMNTHQLTSYGQVGYRNAQQLTGYGRPSYQDNHRLNKYRRARYMPIDTSQSIPTSYASLIPTLRIINASYLIGHITLNIKLTLGNAENIEVIDLAHNNIHECFFPLEGLTNLKILNLSDSDCSKLKPKFLFGFGNLTVLRFAQAGLAEGLKNDPEGIFLSKQTNLEYLDICCNGLLNINDNFLSQNKKIGSINLSNNKLQNIPESVLKTNTLHHLDMSFNVLPSLNEHERHILDSYAGSEKNFSLFLDGNPFICSCSTVDFLEWLADTKIVLDNAGNYSCFSDNGTKSSTWFHISHLQEFRVKCVSDFWLQFSVICCGLAFLTLVMSAFGYRYRWNIKYWFLTRCTGRYNPAPEEQHYIYDVFVAYNHEDYQWVCGSLRKFLEETGPHKYRICLHHRDFPVGQSIQSNIVTAMNESRKIILVLTTQFLTCTWGEYEMEIAAMRDVTGPPSGDGIIIAVLLDDVPTRLMPRVLLNMWKNITFLVWSQDPLDEQVFWNRLSEAMGR